MTENVIPPSGGFGVPVSSLPAPTPEPTGADDVQPEGEEESEPDTGDCDACDKK